MVSRSLKDADDCKNQYYIFYTSFTKQNIMLNPQIDNYEEVLARL